MSNELQSARLKRKFFASSRDLSFERKVEVENSVVEEWMEAISSKTERHIRSSGLAVSTPPSKEQLARLSRI